jgi:hypothetical protein
VKYVSIADRKRIEADIITGPAWPPEGRAFCAAVREAAARDDPTLIERISIQ